jgi:acetamidase/formamidase
MIKKGSTVFYLPYGVYGELLIEQGKVLSIGKGKTITVAVPSGGKATVRIEHIAETHFELSTFWTTVSLAEKQRCEAGVAIEELHKKEEDLVSDEMKLESQIDDLYRKRKTMICSRLR